MATNLDGAFLTIRECLRSMADLDWGRVHVMLTDERWVGEDNSHSNARLVRQRLLTDHAAGAIFISPSVRSPLACSKACGTTACSIEPACREAR